jgi:hypothetical protein
MTGAVASHVAASATKKVALVIAAEEAFLAVGVREGNLIG